MSTNNSAFLPLLPSLEMPTQEKKLQVQPACNSTTLARPAPKYKVGDSVISEIRKYTTYHINASPSWHSKLAQWYYSYEYGLGGYSEGFIIETDIIGLAAIPYHQLSNQLDTVYKGPKSGPCGECGKQTTKQYPRPNCGAFYCSDMCWSK